MSEDSPVINPKALDWAIKRKDWTPARLAKESGVNKSTFTLLAQGKSQGISAINVARMARALEVSTDFLLGLTENPEQKPAMDMAISEIVAIAKTLSEFRQRDLLLIAQTYRDADDPTPEMLQKVLEIVEEVAGEGARTKLVAALASLRSATGSAGHGPSA